MVSFSSTCHRTWSRRMLDKCWVQQEWWKFMARLRLLRLRLLRCYHAWARGYPTHFEQTNPAIKTHFEQHPAENAFVCFCCENRGWILRATGKKDKCEKKSGIKGKKKEKKKKKIQKEPFTPSQTTTLVRKKW